MPAPAGPVAQAIINTLDSTFSPDYLAVEDESHRHSVPPGAESHFKVTLVCTAFDGQRAVARHQQVYAALAEPLAGPVHALALHTFTPAEWQARDGAVTASPDCRGGSRAEQRG